MPNATLRLALAWLLTLLMVACGSAGDSSARPRPTSRPSALPSERTSVPRLDRPTAGVTVLAQSGQPEPTASMKPTRADTATPTAVATATPQPALFDCRSASMIPMAECEALVALYANTDGAHWSDSSGWLTDASPCEWYGVQCADGVVVGLSLPGNQLTGVIPSSLKDLARLETLDLSGNQFTGSIPPVLAELSSLVGLALSTNQLTGDIPPELALLSGLVALDLAGNQLTGSIPPELAELPNLVALGLASNQLTGSIPPEFAELAYLSALSLSDNPLTGGIPLGLMNLTLTWFEYANTGLCEPLEPQFQAWLQSIPHLTRTGVACPN